MYIYYLKLYFGDSFNYSFWNTSQSLGGALDELNSSIFSQSDTAADKVLVKKDIAALREYHRLMITSDIEDFIFGSKVNFSYIIKQMQQAVEIFPEDLWSFYWLAYMETEHGDYKNAAAHWEYIISQPISTCMETLPAIYKRLAKCYQKLGEKAKSEKCLEMANSLTNEHHLIVDTYVDIK
jgi:tetratricopeptide (TPR) repeat protein